jgi:hypothetical protein
MLDRLRAALNKLVSFQVEWTGLAECGDGSRPQREGTDELERILAHGHNKLYQHFKKTSSSGIVVLTSC